MHPELSYQQVVCEDTNHGQPRSVSPPTETMSDNLECTLTDVSEQNYFGIGMLDIAYK